VNNVFDNGVRTSDSELQAEIGNFSKHT